ncbi:hypothetical protein MAR_007703 [Mya arenaria]|uniref:Uncharacterized protein n=1 Tax=Mya arenaria TaxID=6604 RepID=A0ABY7DTW4_MYAAR|nr:hypothetical protein MAR_007703 [Mya arenaria]
MVKNAAHLEDFRGPRAERLLLATELITLRDLVDPLGAEISEHLVQVVCERAEVGIGTGAQPEHREPMGGSPFPNVLVTISTSASCSSSVTS